MRKKVWHAVACGVCFLIGFGLVLGCGEASSSSPVVTDKQKQKEQPKK